MKEPGATGNPDNAGLIEEQLVGDRLDYASMGGASAPGRRNWNEENRSITLFDEDDDRIRAISLEHGFDARTRSASHCMLPPHSTSGLSAKSPVLQPKSRRRGESGDARAEGFSRSCAREGTVCKGWRFEGTPFGSSDYAP